jgi:branched-chain amino acid transport system substrate-binding protein
MQGQHTQKFPRFFYLIAGLLVFMPTLSGQAATGEARAAVQPVLIGLDADMSSGSAESGLAIQRGIELAIDEINAHGGVLGRPISLVVRDHHGNPTRGIDNIVEFAGMPDLVAVMGGLHTPVALAELPAIHEHQIIYLGPWAAGTSVVDNGYSPNFVFRVSVRDSFAGGYLIDQALKRGFKRPALLLENTGWGRSNEKAMKRALVRHGLEPATVQWVNWGAKQVSEQLLAIDSARADVIILVANAPEGAVIVKDISTQPADKRRPVISHWGITGGNFFQDSHSALEKIDLAFLQTFSFLATASNPRSAVVARTYMTRYDDCDTVAKIKSPAGTAHAYDLTHILALAVNAAGSFDRNRVRDALEQVEYYQGLVREYAPPFTPRRHDALSRDDFHMARYDRDGYILRIEEK